MVELYGAIEAGAQVTQRLVYVENTLMSWPISWSDATPRSCACVN